MNASRTVAVYIDGFSLYYALLQKKYPQYKWLDLKALCKKLYPDREVIAIKFFTAELKPLTNDPGVGQRQQVYWRALRDSGVEIIEGTFIFTKPYYPVYPEEIDSEGKVKTVRVKRPEEKGTDVALATHLIVDALDGLADSFAVLTNDSDLVAPIREITKRGFDVSFISVMGEKYNKAFRSDIVSSVRQIRESVLSGSQFPDSINAPNGQVIRKPNTWL